MIELAEKINEYVISRVPAAGTNINEDFFSADAPDGAEVMIRHDPVPFVARRYLSVSYWAGFNFSYYSRAADPIAARNVLESILEALSLDAFVDMLGVSQGRIEVTARPTPVAQGEDGLVTYTSSYRLVYFEEV